MDYIHLRYSLTCWVFDRASTGPQIIERVADDCSSCLQCDVDTILIVHVPVQRRALVFHIEGIEIFESPEEKTNKSIG